MSAPPRPLLDQLAITRRVVARFAAAPDQIGRFLLKRRKRYLADTIAFYDRLLADALPPQVEGCLAAARGSALVAATEGVGSVTGSSAADLVVGLYRAGIARIRQLAGGQTPAAEPSVQELIAATPVVESILEAWRQAAAHWAQIADEEFRQAIATEQGKVVSVSAGSGRKVTPAKRALSTYLARFAHHRVGVRTFARLASLDAQFQTLLRDTGCDLADEASVLRTLEAALRWARKHLVTDREVVHTSHAARTPHVFLADTPDECALDEADGSETDHIAAPCLVP